MCYKCLGMVFFFGVVVGVLLCILGIVAAIWHFEGSGSENVSHSDFKKGGNIWKR